MLLWALRYQKMDLSVIPLRPRAKEPLIPWTEFQSRKATEEEIQKWWAAVPNANIGIVTGKISGIAVIDLDGPEGLASASKLGLRSTATYLTGNGKQLWYKQGQNQTIQNSVKSVPGVDIRGDGGYVVVPPSVHPNGKRYRWLGAMNLSRAISLPSFPMELLSVSKAVEKENKEGWISQALGGMKDGNIDNTLTSVLGRLRHDGYTSADAYTLLEPHARSAGATDGHLEEKIRNVWERYSPAARVENIQRGLPTNGEGLIPRLYTGNQQTEGLVIHSPNNEDSWKQFEARNVSEPLDKLNTGFPKLDAMLTGGLKSERLLTVAALTGHGKTNFGIGLAKNLCSAGKVVLYFSTEFGYKKVWQRYIAALKDPESFREHKFNVCDSFTPNIEQVEDAITRIKPDVFIFDYIQHVSKEKEKLTEFMKGCQFLQRKYECQGVILAQLNRGADWVENGKRIEPRLSMIEGSATIEQASSRVLLLSMSKQTPEFYEIQGYLAKNDDGDTGLVTFALYRQPYHLEEL